MKDTKEKPAEVAPTVTDEQLAELRARLAIAPREPVLPTGTVSECPNCGGKMVTTNDLDYTVATPGLVYVIARLPGARCVNCDSTELDGMGVAILESKAPRGLVADYETSVTHSSGTTLGTYFKVDLVRVLGLSGNERLYWKIVDRDKALVQVHRNETWLLNKSGDRGRTARVARGTAETPHKRGKKLRTEA